MSALDLMTERYSVRSFSNRSVEKVKLERILTAGRIAPTACNIQPQKVIVVQSEEGLARWRRCTECHFNEQLVLIVCYDSKRSWKRVYDGKDSGDVDASIAATQMMLAAWELGIGSTWIMYFIPEAVREEFCLPEGIVPVCALSMGYAAEGVAPSAMHFKRKPLDETVVCDRF